MSPAVLLCSQVILGAWVALADPQRDVPYAGPGSTARQTLDIYAPAGKGTDRPIVVWVHGGAWRLGDKAHVGEKPAAFNARGYVLVSVNYRLQPEVDVQAQAADVARAVAWVRKHASEFGGAANRVFLLGHSAGAHLAALVATDPAHLKQAGLGLDALRGVMLLDGAGYDVPIQYRFGGPRVKKLYGDAFGEDLASQRAASPITHVAAGQGTPPFLILYVASRPDSRRQSQRLAERLNAVGVEARAVPAEGKTHATINRELGLPDDEPTREVFEFLERRSR